jgi:hypothetical protein
MPWLRSDLRASPIAQDGAFAHVCRYRQRQSTHRASGYRAVGVRRTTAALKAVSRAWRVCGRRDGAVLAGCVCRYPATPSASRIAAPDRAALGMKARAGLAATSSAKSSSACVEIKIVGASAPNPLR